MQTRSAEGRHLADKRTPSTGSRTAQFLRLARARREEFHIAREMTRETTDVSRLKHFLRIARGRTV